MPLIFQLSDQVAMLEYFARYLHVENYFQRACAHLDHAYFLDVRHAGLGGYLAEIAHIDALHVEDILELLAIHGDHG